MEDAAHFAFILELADMPVISHGECCKLDPVAVEGVEVVEVAGEEE